VLLLDFGGVLVDGGSRPGWPARTAEVVQELLAERGAPVPETLAADVTAGTDAYGRWGDAMSRPWAPAELSHREFWSQFVAADWPDAARAVVTEGATELCHRLGRLRHDWYLRPGVPQLLAAAAGRGIALAIVSNTLYGAVHREFLAAAGLAHRFAVQLYSDEVGIRKPNPELLGRAAHALGVPVREAWYVGDTWSRDVLCGRRAGVGRTVLMRSLRTDTDLAYPRPEPDLVVADPAELHAQLP
jgi:phosphoglycolate phosphatase-like HAD superfamily hydrolase